jgi:hypothetical protein
VPSTDLAMQMLTVFYVAPVDGQVRVQNKENSLALRLAHESLGSADFQDVLRSPKGLNWTWRAAVPT